jgi:hypothetical protein
MGMIFLFPVWLIRVVILSSGNKFVHQWFLHFACGLEIYPYIPCQKKHNAFMQLEATGRNLASWLTGCGNHPIEMKIVVQKKEKKGGGM